MSIENRALPTNPKSSELTALALVRIIESRRAPLRVSDGAVKGIRSIATSEPLSEGGRMRLLSPHPAWAELEAASRYS